MPENVLYKLECITDNPKYEGFGFVREASLRGKGRLSWDFGPDNIPTEGRAWTVTPLTPVWTPQPVEGRVRTFNDYPCVNLMIPAFSRRAVDSLRDLLEPNGELLPLASTVGEYYAYNVTTVVDILDHEKSEVDWMGNDSNSAHVIASQITRYECAADKVAGLSIFRIVEKPSSTYVSQVFVDRVDQHALQGFHFVKLWPLPDGVSWQEEERKLRKKESQVKTRKQPAPVKGNTVVLFLPIAKAKLSKAEKELLSILENEIDGLLYDPAASPDATYSGSVEGHDYDDGQIRIFLSCPDADALVEKLRPWLKTLNWQGGLKVLKRYGEYADVNCREEYVDP